MKVTHVAVCPSEASGKAGRPALTPELLAASGARYSRNNEGLESILAKIDPHDLDKSVDSIFRMVDYGHQSIADMVPVAIFMDGISIWLAYYLWTLCPTAAGQESSTRYLKIPDDLIAPEDLGIPAGRIPEWRALMEQCLVAYQKAAALWEELAAATPAVMGIPRSLRENPSEAARKKVRRMQRNYVFDRARYFIPVGAVTNMMLVMSARGWVNLCQRLLSHALPEARRLGTAIRSELELSAPRMVKHARCTECVQGALAQEFEACVRMARASSSRGNGIRESSDLPAPPFLKVMPPEGVTAAEMARALACHEDRYAPIGAGLQRTGVRFGWPAMGFAEIRDLNRHRTGTKYCPQVPQGFYYALDQFPGNSPGLEAKRAALVGHGELGRTASRRAAEQLQAADPTYIYWSLLGTEYPFEHITTADKFIYEAELRTGLGAHFRYARHFRDVLALWYEQFPATQSYVLEGSAEPE